MLDALWAISHSPTGKTRGTLPFGLLEERQGICQWCNKPATAKSTTTKPRQLKSSRRRTQRQVNCHNGYDQLQGNWLTYYKIASKFSNKAKAEDKEDLLHDVMLTLASAEQNNGHEPFTEATMYRIASHARAQYWRTYYQLNNGLTCGNCSKEQRQKCKEDYLYPTCPKAIRLERLSKPVIDADGNTTELGEVIANDMAVDINVWHDDTTWELGYRRKLVDIAYKLHRGEALTEYERLYLCRLRKREQKSLLK